MEPTQVRPTGFVSVNAAADYLGLKPWDVVRLAESNQLDSVTLIDAASLSTYAGGRK